MEYKGLKMNIGNIVNIDINNREKRFNNFIKRTKLTFFHFLKTRILTLIVLLVLLVISVYILITNKDLIDLSITKVESGDIFNVVTLVIILAVWWAELKESWQASLPKYLTVKFFFNNEELRKFRSTLIFFLHEADCRSMAQSLGQLKNNNERLPLDIAKAYVKKSVYYDLDCDKAFYHYESKVLLTKLPDAKENKTKKECLEDIDDNLSQLSKISKQEYNQSHVADIMVKVKELCDKNKQNDNA